MKSKAESEILYDQILDYCEKNEYKDIPLAAKAEAIMYIEFKFKDVALKDVNEEFTYLRDYWKRNETNVLKDDLNDYQKRYLRNLKEEIIITDCKNLSLFSDEKNKTLDEKIMQFEVLGFVNANETKKYRDLVIHLYFYYLAKYEEFLPMERKPSKSKEIEEIDYSKHSENFATSHKKIEHLTVEFLNIMEKANTGSVPYHIYQLITNFSKELTTMKSESGLNDKLYIDSSTKVVQLSTIFLMDWIKPNSSIINVPIQGLPIGNTLLDICNAGFDEISRIEMDNTTRVWFSNILASFNLIKEQFQPKSGCYIATMAYGDFSHPQVILLRHYRDTYLVNNYFGKLFIKIYYRISPKFVELFGKTNIIVWTSRKFLDTLIKYILPKELSK